MGLLVRGGQSESESSGRTLGAGVAQHPSAPGPLPSRCRSPHLPLAAAADRGAARNRKCGHRKTDPDRRDFRQRSRVRNFRFQVPAPPRDCAGAHPLSAQFCRLQFDAARRCARLRRISRRHSGGNLARRVSGAPVPLFRPRPRVRLHLALQRNGLRGGDLGNHRNFVRQALLPSRTGSGGGRNHAAVLAGFPPRTARRRDRNPGEQLFGRAGDGDRRLSAAADLHRFRHCAAGQLPVGCAQLQHRRRTGGLDEPYRGGAGRPVPLPVLRARPLVPQQSLAGPLRA